MAKQKTRAQLAAEKTALVEEARKLGIYVAGKNATQLRKAIDQAKEAGGDAPDAKLGGTAPAKNAKEVNVIDANGVIRTYSEAEHGKKFRELADEFASKAEGRKVVAVE